MPDLDVDLDDTLRRLAREMVAEPPEVPDLAVLVPSAEPVRRRPRRGPILAAAATVVALALVAGAVAVRGGDEGDDGPPSVVADDTGLSPAPQRLVIGNMREVLADGSVVDLERGRSDSGGTVRFRPDGGYAFVGMDMQDNGLSEGDTDATLLRELLIVVGPGGDLELERKIPVSQLLAMSDTEAVMTRRLDDDGELDPFAPERLLVHDLATGEERPIGEGITFDPEHWLPGTTTLVGDRLVTIEAPIERGSDGPCTLRVADLTTGADTRHQLDLDCAVPILDLRVSPDGSRAAFGYLDTYDLPSLGGGPVHLAVVDLSDGAVVDDELPDLEDSIEGMVWKDDATLRIATSPVSTDDSDDITVHEVPVG